MKLVLPLLFLAALAGAQEPDSTSALFSLREAERSFAKASVASGRQEAFAEFLAPVSIVFTDKWITGGKELWKQRKPSPVVLKWEPGYMEISAGGDFGVSTGPWEAQEYRPGTQPLGSGCFLSVWQRELNGPWKVILDAGINTPSFGILKHSFTFTENKNVRRGAVAEADTVLMTADKEFLSAWKKNPSLKNFLQYHQEKFRMLLDGHFPSENSDTIAAWTKNLGNKLVWIASGARISPSGDIGFSYGMIGNDAAAINGHYVRIWKKQADRRWLIALEMINP